MRILFTGASSFSGSWFVQQLAAAGHDVVAPVQLTPGQYRGVRAERVAIVERCAQVIAGTAFGDEEFLASIAGKPFDLLCCHHADVRDYKSDRFDYLAATSRNTQRLADVMTTLERGGCRRMIATGSVFEADEGTGDEPRRAFSPYGLSKTLTWHVLRQHALQREWRIGKFVIANPFGPREEPRFTSYLVKQWFAGVTPVVATPDYVRDNIHVGLLARAYVAFATALPVDAGISHFAPSGYVETQGEFALRFAREIGPRLDLAAGVELAEQVDFPEPRARANTDALDHEALHWNESAAWDELADDYRGRRTSR